MSLRTFYTGVEAAPRAKEGMNDLEFAVAILQDLFGFSSLNNSYNRAICLGSLGILWILVQCSRLQTSATNMDRLREPTETRLCVIHRGCCLEDVSRVASPSVWTGHTYCV